ncbi:MAG: hypothetical protein ACXVXC_00020 [Nocardioidaceae bacterium]
MGLSHFASPRCFASLDELSLVLALSFPVILLMGVLLLSHFEDTLPTDNLFARSADPPPIRRNPVRAPAEQTSPLIAVLAGVDPVPSGLVAHATRPETRVRPQRARQNPAATSGTRGAHQVIAISGRRVSGRVVEAVPERGHGRPGGQQALD